MHPEGLRNQIKGCILQTLSRTLHEEVTFTFGGGEAACAPVPFTTARLTAAQAAAP